MISKFFLFNFFISFLVGGTCQYDFSDSIQITNFTNLSKNDLNGSQGVTGDAPFYEKVNDTVGEIQDARSFYSYTFDPDTRKPLDISKFDYFNIKVLNLAASDFNSELVFGFTEEEECYLDRLTYRKVWLSKFRFSYELQNGYQAAYSVWKIMMDTNLKKLCKVEIQFLMSLPWTKSIYFHSLKFLNVKTRCEPQLPPSNENFVWRNQSKLIYKGKPFRYLSFLALNFINGSALEQEDLAKTIVDFTNGTNLILKTTPLGENPDAKMGYDTASCKSCYIFTNKSRLYNEVFLIKLDRSIAIAGKYGLKLVIPYFSRIQGLPFLVLQALKIDYNDFYFDSKIIEDQKHLIGTVLNRTNTITGIKYKDDPTIMSWSIGDDLVLQDGGFGPPSSWVKTISEYIKSIDCNHLIHVGWSASRPFHSEPTFDDLMLISVDMYTKNVPSTISDPLMGPKVANDFGKVFAFDEIGFDTQNLKYHLEHWHDDPEIAGIFVKAIAGRKEGEGFYMTWKHGPVLHYPGYNSSYDNSIVAGEKDVMLNLSLDYRRLFLDRFDNTLDPVLSFPPTILSVEKQSQRVIQITWMGAVGATRHELYVSENRGQTRLFRRLENEFQEFSVEYFVADQDCKYIKFTLFGFYDNRQSPAANFDYIWSPNKSAICIEESHFLITSSTKNLNGDYDYKLFLGILIPFGIVVFTLSIVFCYLRNRNGRKVQLKKTISMEMLNIVEPPTRIQSSSFTKSNINSAHHASSSVTITIPTMTSEVDSSCTTSTITNHRNEHILYIPGYLQLVEGADFKLCDDKSLGSGATATIRKGLSLKMAEQQVFAIKYFENVTEKRFQFEVAVMNHLSKHDNVIKIVGYQDKPQVIVMELCDGDIFEFFVTSSVQRDVKTKLKCVKEMASACDFIHANGIIHFDLKCKNMLYQKKGPNDYVFKLTDFGFARLVNSNFSPEYYAVKGLDHPENVGFSLRYCSPEMVIFLSKNPKYFTEEMKKFDIYSFAIVMYEVFTGKLCWGKTFSLETYLEEVVKGHRPAFPQKFLGKCDHFDPNRVKNLIEKCWIHDLKKRPSFSTILKEISKITEE